MVVLDDIVMFVNASMQSLRSRNELEPMARRGVCPHHDYDLLRPVVMVTPLLGVKGDFADDDAGDDNIIKIIRTADTTIIISYNTMVK